MRPLAIALPVVAATVALTGGCATLSPAATPAATPGAQTTDVTTPATTSRPVAKPAASTRPATKPAGGSGGGATTTAFCHTADTSATVTGQPERTSGSTRMAMIMLTNTSKHACAVDGWVSVSLVNAADELVPVHTTEVNQPGRPVRTVLKPGTTAYAGIKWTACGKDADSCGAGNTLRFNLDASTDGDVAELAEFPAPETSGITMSNLRIGSLQPIRQGVVAW